MINRLATAVALACLAAAPAHAAASAWHEAAGGSVRLVTAGPLGSNGELRGALQIDLKPGWKTYWRDPGSSGVPPVFDLTANGEWTSATLDFPAPQRHHDESGSWAGYDYPVSLPVVLKAAPGKAPASVDGSVFLGVCEKICVPLQAPIALTIDTAATPSDETMIVEAAWAALPAPATAEFGVLGSAVANDPATGETVVGALKAPSGISDFFLAGEQGYLFGETSLLAKPSETVFSVKIVSRPKTTPTGPGLRYTLVTGQGAVSGTIPYP